MCDWKYEHNKIDIIPPNKLSFYLTKIEFWCWEEDSMKKEKKKNICCGPPKNGASDHHNSNENQAGVTASL